MATAGVDPDFMGIGPVPASRKLMARLNLSIKDFGLIEINEAFASQVIASLRDLAWILRLRTSPTWRCDRARASARHVRGAACDDGRSGLQETGAQRALVTMCVGVGQGLALAVERV